MMLRKDLTHPIMKLKDRYKKGLNKKVIEIMKGELDGNTATKIVKTYNHLTHGGNGDKKAKRTEKCVLKRKIEFEDYKNCLKSEIC